MTLQDLLNEINTNPEKVEFNDVINVIDSEYNYSPSRFINGKADDAIINESGSNEGSCKIFAFAKLNNLNKQQTLACFGKYYREDVLQHPDANDHANIRSLIKNDLDNIQFDNDVLEKK